MDHFPLVGTALLSNKDYTIKYDGKATVFKKKDVYLNISLIVTVSLLLLTVIFPEIFVVHLMVSFLILLPIVARKEDIRYSIKGNENILNIDKHGLTDKRYKHIFASYIIDNKIITHANNRWSITDDDFIMNDDTKEVERLLFK